MSLRVDRVSKRFGSVEALRPLTLEFSPGEIHAVVGENGAGKSTLVNILSGFVNPTSGSVTLGGVELRGGPLAFRGAGIEMIHQHFTLVGSFTAEENLALSAAQTVWRMTRTDDLAAKALTIGKALGWNIPRNTPVRTLPVGVLQRLEILKALAADAEIVLFDEPTAVLAPDEVLDLFNVIRRLRDEGKTVVLIAHKLSEVFAIADRVTVLRRGEQVFSRLIGDVTPEEVAEAMVSEMAPAIASKASVAGDAVLRITGLTTVGDRKELALRGLNLEVGASEIVGIAGVDGNGQVELAEVVVGIRRSTGGSVWIQEGARIGYIPQDRQTDGLAMSMSVLDNAWIEGVRRPELTRGPIRLLNKGRKWVRDLISRFQIRAPSIGTPVGSLSGGNQQKVVCARVLDQRPDLLVVVSPTRGLDLKATEFVHQQIRDARSSGTAVLLISTDLDEVLAISDRVLAISRGELSPLTTAGALVGNSQ